jgi:hypothetical protein
LLAYLYLHLECTYPALGLFAEAGGANAVLTLIWRLVLIVVGIIHIVHFINIIVFLPQYASLCHEVFAAMPTDVLC